MVKVGRGGDSRATCCRKEAEETFHKERTCAHLLQSVGGGFALQLAMGGAGGQKAGEGVDVLKALVW